MVIFDKVDGGVTWSDPPVVLTAGLGSVLTPRVAFNKTTGQIHVVFAAPDSAGRYQVTSAVGQIEILAVIDDRQVEPFRPIRRNVTIDTAQEMRDSSHRERAALVDETGGDRFAPERAGALNATVTSFVLEHDIERELARTPVLAADQARQLG